MKHSYFWLKTIIKNIIIIINNSKHVIFFLGITYILAKIIIKNAMQIP